LHKILHNFYVAFATEHRKIYKFRKKWEIFVKNQVLIHKLLLFCAGFTVELAGQAHFLPFHLPLAKFFIIL